MKAVIAEKPSVAREIAALIGATEKCDGYITGNDYMVTWAYGHLIALGMPEDYGITGFNKDALPMLPNPFQLTVRKVKKEKGYQTDGGALKQLKIIEQVLKKCDSIIVATDAGREGELIFRYIYEYLKCNKPFERLWISSLTEKAIKQGFENLKPGKEFDSLSEAAKSRSRADWLVGINASQALSIAAGHGIYSLGRVQTPTLALICKRYQENKNFSTKHYWQIQMEHRKHFTDFKSTSKTRWDSKMKAEEHLRAIERKGVSTVCSVESKSIIEQPPLLFDLTGLQKEANRKLNFSADETLTIAQSLYEKKFITYPRTGSKYIPEDQWPEIPNLIRALSDSDTFKEAASKLSWGHFNKRIVNDLKVTDHHGLLITEKIPSKLSGKENAIYELIAYRLLESLCAACSKEITDVVTEVLDCDFTMKGTKVMEPGWRGIRNTFSEEDTEVIQELPELEIGEALKIKKAIVLEKKTSAPALYTEATLLSAMENAGKEVQNEQERKILNNVGIGTPATRASIIETLFSRGYIEREKKSLMPTEKGMEVYELVKDKNIANAVMTAEWEMALEKIENKEAKASDFLDGMEDYVTMITKQLLSVTFKKDNLPELFCPKCGKPLVIHQKIIKCIETHCGWLQYRAVCGVQLSIYDIEILIKKRKSPLIKGMKSKSGKVFNAFIVMNENGETSFEFEIRKPNKKNSNLE
ncbi:DNA topoisomerase 3 [Pedobacter agri]|uniref:type IA DNA topoisomerase n=1 Tax=Pedobacter agri TaxID=454586 RepID=UPI00292F998A|nr:DNA topoisomerase 3 [Pedobacter agri]